MDESQFDVDMQQEINQPETDNLGDLNFPLEGNEEDYNGEMQLPEMTDGTHINQDAMSKLFVNGDEFSNNPNQDDDDNIYPPYADPMYRMPDEIEVRVEGPEGDYYFPVKIEKSNIRKIYIGGFRNKRTGTIYHHAHSQTPTENKHSFLDNSHMRTRETQTVETRTVSIQSYREFGTQMERVDCYIDVSNDKELVAKPYYTSTELDAAKRIKAIELQRNWRGYVARLKAAKLKIYIATREKKEFQDRVDIVKKEKEILHRELQRKVNPTSKLDFALLYNELDTWRKQEVVRIKATTERGDDRKAAMLELLASETKALQSIQQLKYNSNINTTEDKTEIMLQLMAQPHKWKMSDGNTALVQTPAIQRAKELYELHKALTSPLVSVNQRLEVLLNVKWTIKAVEPCMLIKTLSDLLDREADLLNRGRPFKSMEALRFRIKNLFLQFIEDPMYNPRAQEFINIPLMAPPPGVDGQTQSSP